MNIVLVYSSKNGLQKEFRYRNNGSAYRNRIPDDFYAEGDSKETIEAVKNALQSFGHQVVGIEGNDSALEKITKNRPQLVFNIAEGLFGDFRESYIPMICERRGIPYTGSDPLTLGICLNKARTKEILSFYFIPNAPFRVFYPFAEINTNEFEYPAIVKPVAEGSSKGIEDGSFVDNPKTAKEKIQEKMLAYDQPVVLEKFLTGREYTVAVWGNGSEVQVLPIVEINHSKLPAGAHPIYSYEAKWIWDTPSNPLEIFTCPAEIDLHLKIKIEEIVKDTYSALGLKDWGRIDIRLDESDIPNVIEVNPLPGILPKPEDNSCFPKAARAAGYDYKEMLNKVVRIAAKRYGIEQD